GDVGENKEGYTRVDGGSARGLVAGRTGEAALGGAVDQPADEADFFARALELDTRRIGSLHWQAGKAGEPIRVARHRRGEMIIEFARQRDAVGAGKEVRTRAAV